MELYVSYIVLNFKHDVYCVPYEALGEQIIEIRENIRLVEIFPVILTHIAIDKPWDSLLY